MQRLHSLLVLVILKIASSFNSSWDHFR